MILSILLLTNGGKCAIALGFVFCVFMIFKIILHKDEKP